MKIGLFTKKPTGGKFIVSLAVAGLLGVLAVPNVAACACGCGIFEVGTGALFPTAPGGKISFEWDYMDQNQNWSGLSQAAAANNNDKEIVSNFFKLNGQFMFNHSWGIEIDIPYTARAFSTLDSNGVTVDTFNHAAFGDVRISGMFTGISPDMSTGLSLGVKLPTGDSTYANFDADTEIGSGSTDLLLGFYHFGQLFESSNWNWTVEAGLDQPILTQNNYTPGSEIDASVGINYRGIAIGDLNIVPIVQLAGSFRANDSGANADPADSGYTRYVFIPGLDLELGSWRLIATADLPFYQNVNGNQLVAPVLLKVMASVSF
jgi:hypothetical protein